MNEHVYIVWLGVVVGGGLTFLYLISIYVYRRQNPAISRKLQLEQQIESLKSQLADRERVIDRLRGQLQNCVNHLDRAKRITYGEDKFSKCIESANQCLYETLIDQQEASSHEGD